MESDMKTREEIVAAINEISSEAAQSGFTFCAGLDAEGVVLIVSVGNYLTVIGLADWMHMRFRKNMGGEIKK
jgi:hypothetical protein